MKYTMDTKLGDIMDDPQAKDIIEKHVPGMYSNPMVGMAKGMSLKSLLDMPQAQQAGITQDRVQKVLDEINAREMK